MPSLIIERPQLSKEMRDALKRHILRERQRKKDEADANEADKKRRRAEKAKALSSSKVQLDDNAKDILALNRLIADLEQQKAEQYNLLKRALNDEDRRKHSQQTVMKEPSWTSLYPTTAQMAHYAHHPQHYLSAQQSHRLLAYKPPPSQPPSFIPTTTPTNMNSKRSHSPTPSHIYSSSPNKAARLTLIPPTHTRPLSPNSKYTSSSYQANTRNVVPILPSSHPQSAFSTYHSYMPPTTQNTAAVSPTSYPNPMPVIRASSQMSNYMNQLPFLSQQMIDRQQQGANIYPHHPMLRPSPKSSIMNGYPLHSQH